MSEGKQEGVKEGSIVILENKIVEDPVEGAADNLRLVFRIFIKSKFYFF